MDRIDLVRQSAGLKPSATGEVSSRLRTNVAAMAAVASPARTSPRQRPDFSPALAGDPESFVRSITAVPGSLITRPGTPKRASSNDEARLGGLLFVARKLRA